jgi:hypothetical protein
MWNERIHNFELNAMAFLKGQESYRTALSLETAFYNSHFPRIIYSRAFRRTSKSTRFPCFFAKDRLNRKIKSKSKTLANRYLRRADARRTLATRKGLAWQIDEFLGSV